jgi:hypothetical protein
VRSLALDMLPVLFERRPGQYSGYDSGFAAMSGELPETYLRLQSRVSRKLAEEYGEAAPLVLSLFWTRLKLSSADASRFDDIFQCCLPWLEQLLLESDIEENSKLVDSLFALTVSMGKGNGRTQGMEQIWQALSRTPLALVQSGKASPDSNMSFVLDYVLQFSGKEDFLGSETAITCQRIILYLSRYSLLSVTRFLSEKLRKNLKNANSSIPLVCLVMLSDVAYELGSGHSDQTIESISLIAQVSLVGMSHQDHQMRKRSLKLLMNLVHSLSFESECNIECNEPSVASEQRRADARVLMDCLMQTRNNKVKPGKFRFTYDDDMLMDLDTQENTSSLVQLLLSVIDFEESRAQSQSWMNLALEWALNSTDSFCSEKSHQIYRAIYFAVSCQSSHNERILKDLLLCTQEAARQGNKTIVLEAMRTFQVWVNFDIFVF